MPVTDANIGIRGAAMNRSVGIAGDASTAGDVLRAAAMGVACMHTTDTAKNACKTIHIPLRPEARLAREGLGLLICSGAFTRWDPRLPASNSVPRTCGDPESPQLRCELMPIIKLATKARYFSHLLPSY